MDCDYHNMTDEQLELIDYWDDQPAGARAELNHRKTRREEEERRHQETLQAIRSSRGIFGFGFVGSVVIVLWVLGLYH
jgi:hypothetical protein